MTLVQRLLPMIVLVLLSVCLPACSARERAPAIYEPAGSIERPARPLAEEKSTGERAEEVATVILVLGITIGLILIPILLL